MEYGVSISTDISDWLDEESRVDTPLIGLRFQLGKDEWTQRYVLPVFGGIGMMASLIHQMTEHGHDDLPLDLFREADSKQEQAAILGLLTKGRDQRSEILRDLTYPEDEPTIDLIRATAALISMVMSANKDAAAVAIGQIDEAGGLPAVCRFMALMAGRAMGYIAMMTSMDPDSVMHILAGAAMFESQQDERDDGTD